MTRKIRKLPIWVLTFVLLVVLLPKVTFANQQTLVQNSHSVFDGGDGSEESPFLISTPEQLSSITNFTEKLYYQLEADLILNESYDYLNWKTNSPNNEWIPFDFFGYLDGKGHTIKGIYINSDNLCVGLFNHVRNGGIYNLTISDSYIVGVGDVGGIAGFLSDAIIENCTVKNSYIEGKYNAGGIAGTALTTSENGVDEVCFINKCYNYADIYSNGSSSNDAGGIVGYSQNSNIKNSYNYGNVETKNLNRSGGIAGRTTGLIENCYNYGNVKSEDYAAGIVAIADNDVNNCTNYGDVTAKSVGGIVAWGSRSTTNKINNCVNMGNITCVSKDYSTAFAGGVSGYSSEIYNCCNKGKIYSNCLGDGHAGGIVGKTGKKTVIKNCCNEGAVDGTNSKIGGIIGSISCYNTTNISDCIIENCYNKGNLGSSSNYIGGIIGCCDSYGYPLIITNCYNDANVECNSNYVGGIAGSLTSGQKICNSFNSGTIIGNSYVGGILGQHQYEIDINENISILNCYNSGKIYAESIFGGIAGQVYGKICFVYNVGKINSGNDTKLLGQLQYSTIIQNGYSISSVTDLENNKLSNQDMLLQKNYQNFDFDNTWEFIENDEYKYPVLKSCSYKPHINNIIPQKLSIEKTPSKTAYKAGDSIDISDAIVICEYSDGSKKNIRYYINEYPYYAAFPKENNITLSYCGLKANIPITIDSEGISDKFNSGDGSLDNPYIVANAEEMAYLALSVNTGFDNYSGKYICVANDISLNTDENNNWTPIGTSNSPFMGNFNGNNKIISKMYIDNDKDYQGLFGHVTNGSIRNIIISDSFLKANNYVGTVVGMNDAEFGNGCISNCHNTINVEGNKFVGGIVGRNNPSIGSSDNIETLDIDNCTNSGSIKGVSCVGGITGWFNCLYKKSSITNSINYGDIISTYESYSYCGGIAGDGCYGIITKCINYGSVKGESSSIGGITGASSNTVSNCVNCGDVHGRVYTGGIIGDGRETVCEENNFNNSYVNNTLEITDAEHKGIIIKTINNENTVKINLTANNYDSSSEQIFVGIYDCNNRLLSVERYSTLNENEIEIEKDTPKRFIKIFCWKGNLQPLSIALVITCT